MNDPVTVFVRPGCSNCRLVKEYLDGHGVAYRERDVTRDEAAAEEVRRFNAPGLPVIVIGRVAVLGFDKVRLDDLLKARGVPIGGPI
jgi:glutaredoxin